MEYRKKKFRVQFFYPLPKEYTFEESQELFLKHLEKVLMPTLKKQAIRSFLEENRSEINNKS